MVMEDVNKHKHRGFTCKRTELSQSVIQLREAQTPRSDLTTQPGGQHKNSYIPAAYERDGVGS